MGLPGEIPQEIGRAYVQLLIGCLERTVEYFQRTFEVHEAPQKLTFGRPTCSEFSFDVLGVYSHPYRKCEVLIESKGHKDGDSVLGYYKEFLAKAYVASSYQRQMSDMFWFVTNVPFGSSIGRRLTSPDFVISTLSNKNDTTVQLILGPGEIDQNHARVLSQHLSVCIFTDSFIRRMGAFYKVRPGDNIWSIVSLLHAERLNVRSFESVEVEVAMMNKLDNPHHIQPGWTLRIPWYGFEW